MTTVGLFFFPLSFACVNGVGGLNSEIQTKFRAGVAGEATHMRHGIFLVFCGCEMPPKLAS